MKDYLLYNKTSATSAKQLAKGLGLSASSNIQTHPPIIRYGNSHDAMSIDTEINAPESIELCADSKKFSAFCLENNFNSPIYTQLSTIENFSNLAFPLLIRERWHKAGLDINYISNQLELDTFLKEHKFNLKDYYHVPFLTLDYEARIHVIDKNPQKTMLKVWRGENPPTGVSSFIRSSQFGWSYVIRESKYTKAKDFSVELAQALDIAFVAFDLGYSKREKKYYVFEANSAPGLNSQTLALYIEKIGKLL